MAQAVIPKHEKTLSPLQEAWGKLKRNPIAMLCLFYIGLLIFISIFASFLAPQGFDKADFQHTFEDASLSRPLGTDQQGRDVFVRLLYGVRVSLGVAVVVVVIEVLIGVTLGLAAGYFGGKVDLALMRMTDIMFAFPDILLAILLVAVVQPPGKGTASSPIVSVITLFFALGAVSWPSISRLVRGQALALRDREYIQAAKAMGVKDSEIIRKHLLPNLLSPIIVQVTQDIAQVMLAEATLSFLGLGVQPPYPSWGRMINDSLRLMNVHPLLLVGPTIALALTVMAFNFFGDALRDALDPRLRS